MTDAEKLILKTLDLIINLYTSDDFQKTNEIMNECKDTSKKIRAMLDLNNTPLETALKRDS